MPQPPTPDDAGFSRDKDLERGRGLNRPADADLDATERSADPAPDEHIDFPADVDDEDREALGASGQ